MALRPQPAVLLLTFGVVAFALAGLSVADMFLPRPYDGVVLAADTPDRLVVQEVLKGSGAYDAGVRPGDQIVGIAREALRDAAHAARLLNRFRIGEEVPYLVRTPEGLNEVRVRLGRRRIGDGTYLYSCALGFSFFLVGLFVLSRQPALRASQVFFLLCGLFLLFLVCRMRPPSYSGVDSLVLGIGTVALLFLPPAFLHFYMLFPRPAWLQEAAVAGRFPALTLWRFGLPALYLLPPLTYFGSFAVAHLGGRELSLIAGAPRANWWLLAVYMVLGLAALGANARRVKSPRERRGTALVLVGSLFGVVPFLVSSVAFASFQHTETFFVFGVMPLVLVPITFTYACLRFQLLEVRVMLRRSLLYTATTALVTGLYAGGIATFNALFRGTALAGSGYFPIVLALAIVLLFEPLRRQIQGPIDRFFFAGRSRLQRAMVELGEAMTAQVDLQEVVQELVEKLPRLLDLHFAALYLLRGYQLVRLAGPASLPEQLPVLPELQETLRRRGRLTRLDQLATLTLRSSSAARWVGELEAAGVEAIGNLASKRRHLGMVMLSTKRGQIPLEREELTLLEGLLHQAAIALETSLLLTERTEQAELERELQIAAAIQANLLPARLRFAAGWSVAAVCRPARIVGGDFYAQLPTPDGEGGEAIVFGDVSGKSVSGAMMMMAAHEALHSLAMTHREPSELFSLANRRLYALGKRSFVALGYLGASAGGGELRYLVAGQPPPLLRSCDGAVRELPLPDHRIPLGGLADGSFPALEVPVAPGEVVLAYSDGVIEALSPDKEFFGAQRLAAAVAASCGDPGRLVGDVLAAVESFSGGDAPYDDLTLVAVGRRPESER